MFFLPVVALQLGESSFGEGIIIASPRQSDATERSLRWKGAPGCMEAAVGDRPGVVWLKDAGDTSWAYLGVFLFNERARFGRCFLFLEELLGIPGQSRPTRVGRFDLLPWF